MEQLLNRNQMRIMAFTAIIVLFIGYFTSRTIYSIGLLFACVFVVLNYRKIGSIQQHLWMKAIWAVCLCALFADLIHGRFEPNLFFAKLPLVAIALFIFTFAPNPNDITKINFILFAFLGAATIYSLMNYGFNFVDINQNYSKAKVMKVLSYRDHIRISWLIAVSIGLAFYEYFKTHDEYIKRWMVGYIIFQAIYLHVLGSKTGLIVLYGILMSLIIYFLASKKSKISIYLIMLAIAGPALSYKYIPSFYNRLGYVRYDYNFYKDQKYVTGMSDGLRYFSVKGGVEVLTDKILTGTGFSQVKNHMSEWYKKNTPDMKEDEYLTPSSQILIYGIGAGIIGISILIWYLIAPFFSLPMRKSWIFLSCYPISALTFVFETHLEGQLPIFACGFIFTWLMYLAWSDKHDANSNEHEK